MTSTTTTAPAVNGASGNNTTTASTQSNTSGRPATKATSTMKGSDTSRKQSGSPVDGGQRRSNSQKAWTQGSNPITQRASYTQQNGSTPHLKTMSSPKYSGPKETNTPDKHANDRLISLLASCIGLTAVITVKNGDKYSGIFSSSSLEPNDSSFILKMVQKPHLEEAQANGVAEHDTIFVGSGRDHTMAFDVRDIVELSVENVTSTETSSKNQNGASFRTDADISGNLNMRERKLEPWLPPPESSTNLSFEDEGNLGWDQFAENEKRFGLKSDYDENYYTTAINRSGPGYRRKEAEAARKAAEIEGSVVTNPHMREERGLAFEHDGQDEEDKYSGVRRDDTNFPPLQSGQPNKYTPPARRAPTGQPTVYGAPVDPAIISAQMARPDPYPKSNQMKSTMPPKPSAAPETASIVSETPSTQMEKNNQFQATEAPAENLGVTGDSAPKSSAISTSMSPRRKLAGENATATVETDVVEAFKEFANKEKLKVEQNRRDKRSQDKAVKLNDLMSFSRNFKLHTPVPVDLIPILAKDKAKQEKIVEKAQREHDEATANTPPKTTPVTEQKPSRSSGPGRYDVGTAPPPAPADRQNYPRGRQAYPPSGPQNSQGGRMDRSMQGQNATIHSGRNGSLSHRLMDIRQQQKAGAPLAIPAPLPLHENRVPPTGPTVDQSGLSSPQRNSAIHTPTSTISTKFNVKALEFKPNPAASAFTPAGTSNVSSSPRSIARTRSVSRAASPSAFFGTKKPLPASERPSITNQFNPIKRMKKEIEELKATKDGTPDYSANGGIPQSFRTPPTWDVPKENLDKTYADMFDQSIRPPPSVSPQARAASNPPLPHQHQLPLHLQHGAQHGAQHVPQAPAPHQAPHHLHPQQQHYSASPHHFEDQQRMHLSASSSSMFPSPRMQHNVMAYSSPMNTHAQLVYGQPPPAQAFMGQGGPQSGHMRPYGGAPAFVGQQNTHMVAPMMVQQQSNGPFIAMPQGMQGMALPPNYQMGMYSPNPGHVYPQQGGPQQPHSGYPSPSRGAPTMMHQGSQQGHYPQQMMHMNPNQHGQGVYASPQPNHVPMRGYQQQQPQFSSSPHQPHHLPPQSHRVASNTYGAHMQQMPQMPAHIVSQQQPHPSASMSLAPEGVEEVK